MKNRIINILKLLFVAGIFYYLISHNRLDFSTLYRLWMSPFAVIMLLAFPLWIMPIISLRLWLILKTYNFQVPIIKIYFFNWIGCFFNVSLPGSISGDVVKGYYIHQVVQKKDTTKIIVTLLVDRIIGLSSLVIVSFISLLLYDNSITNIPLPQPLVLMIIGLLSGIVIFYGIICYPFQQGKDPLMRIIALLPRNATLLKIYAAFKHFQNHKRLLVFTILLSSSVHVTVAFMLMQVTLFMQKSVTIADQLFIMPIGFLTIAIPLAPGGIGIGHVAFDNLYQMIGISGGADIFNLYISVQLTAFLMGGIPYLLIRNKPDALKPQDHAMKNGASHETENPYRGG